MYGALVVTRPNQQGLRRSERSFQSLVQEARLRAGGLIKGKLQQRAGSVVRGGDGLRDRTVRLEVKRLRAEKQPAEAPAEIGDVQQRYPTLKKSLRDPSDPFAIPRAIRARTAYTPVRIGTSIELISATAAIEPIFSCPAPDPISALTAAKEIVSASAVDDVVAPEGGDDVPTRRPV
jgi:hypothetical protein